MQLIELFTEPRRALAAVAESPTVLLPFLIVLALSLSGVLVYYARVDGAWMVDAILSASGKLSAKELEQARQFSSPGTMKWLTLIGIGVGSVIALLVMGGFFKLAGKLAGMNRSYRHWLAFHAWTSLPMALSALVILIGAFAMPSRTLHTDLQLTHLAPLVFQPEEDSPWKAFLEGFDLMFLWSITLVFIGWQVWGGSRRTAAIVALLPVLAVYGIWALAIVLTR
ncbi:YIP1 family protein [Paludibacterium paludis]|uniref:Yip1 domain-containing protein n=1 Tax=Paludibacterium paludis TaxID=1225769 RepID=A0A918NYA3_9NEIS|nr:YIP1 family protein [Paludibacterium paludis]GGY05460.1 hypothetical protein GCM10011289_05180 [Paludibacterium paludis]